MVVLNTVLSAAALARDIRSILELLMIRDDVLHVPGQLWNRMDVNCCVNNLTLNSRLLDRP